MKIRTADQNLPEGDQRGFLQGLSHRTGRGDRRAVHLSPQQPFHGAGGGIVGDPQVDPRIPPVKRVKAVQKGQMERGFAGGNGNAAGPQTAIRPEFTFAKAQLFKGYGSTAVKSLAFRGQGDAMVGADKQLAAQILLQVVHAAGNVGLVIAQSFGGLGKALVLGNIVKNAVIIVGNSHFFRLRAISFRYVQHIKYTFYIFLLEQYNTGVLRRQVL